MTRIEEESDAIRDRRVSPIVQRFSLRKNLSRWFWADIVLASFTGLLGLITPFFPDWIEAVSGWRESGRSLPTPWTTAVRK
jgi:hypothetical protein